MTAHNTEVSFSIIADSKAPWNRESDLIEWVRYERQANKWIRYVRAASRVREGHWLVMEFDELDYNRVRNGLYWAARRDGVNLQLRRWGREIWAKVTRDKYRRDAARRRSTNPEVVRLENWKWMLLREYGLSVADYQKMAESQQGQCAICGMSQEKLCVDHDAITGRVRGLLCSVCNSGIGFLRHSEEILESAIAYLGRSKQ